MASDALLSAQGLFVEIEGARPPIAAPVDLAVGVGEVLALRGPSGAGKSTALRCVAALEPRARGTLRFRGAPVSDSEVCTFRRAVQLVPQTPPRASRAVEDHWRLAFAYKAAGASGYDPERARCMADDLALPTGIEQRPLGELSGGELQRVALIRALLTDPTVLLLDEPTSALDGDNRARAAALLERWRDGGDRAALVVTHDDATLNAWVTREQTLPGPSA